MLHPDRHVDRYIYPKHRYIARIVYWRPVSLHMFRNKVSVIIIHISCWLIFISLPLLFISGIFVRAEYKLVKIALQDVLYIEGLQDYIRIHLQQGKPVMTLMTLKAMLEKLPPAQFRRIHRSYIVPVNRVTAIVNKKVRIGNTIELPIGDSYAGFIDEWTKQ